MTTHQDNSHLGLPPPPPDNSLPGQFPTWTTSHQDRDNFYNLSWWLVENCSRGELSWWGVVVVMNCPSGKLLRWEAALVGSALAVIILVGSCPVGNCPVGVILIRAKQHEIQTSLGSKSVVVGCALVTSHSMYRPSRSGRTSFFDSEQEMDMFTISEFVVTCSYAHARNFFLQRRLWQLDKP